METKKKETNAQLKRRIQNAIVFVPKVKDTLTIYFSDKGLRLTVTEPDDYRGYAVIETNYHRHVFDEINPNASPQADLPFSRPWVYTKRIIEIANENLEAIEVKDKDGNIQGHSYTKLLEVLRAKEDKVQYNLATFYSWYFFNLFQPLYGIGEDEIIAFLTYENYLHNVARNTFLLDEHKEDVTNKQFVDKVLEIEKSFIEGMEERVITKALSDEERVQQEMEAVAATEAEQQIEESNG